jgi:hypothetical protein
MVPRPAAVDVMPDPAAEPATPATTSLRDMALAEKTKEREFYRSAARSTAVVLEAR